MTADLARVGGPLAAAGLALLVVAPRRDLRIAGLARLGCVGCAFLAVVPRALRPRDGLRGGSRRRCDRRGRARGALPPLAVAHRRRHARLRAGAHPACTSARPTPTCSCRCTRSSAARRCCSAGSSSAATAARASSARSRGRSPLLVAWTGLSLAWTEDLHEGAVALLFFWLPFGVLALSLARLAWSRRWLTFLYVAARRDGARVLGDRRLPVRDARRLLEPEGDRRERVRAVLPRQLRLLRPVGLRPLPRRRDPRRARDRALRPRTAGPLAAAAAIAAIWVGLLFSFSQSSFAALIVGTVVVAAFTWRWRAAPSRSASCRLVIAAVALGTPHIRHSLAARVGLAA